MAGAIEFVLIDLPCEDAVITGSIAEERDYCCCAYEEVDSSAEGEGRFCKVRTVVSHRV